MQNPNLCKNAPGTDSSGFKIIDHIEYPELQKAIRPDADAKGIRLDLYVKDSQNTVYNIEMQTVITKVLPQRSRYYQSMIDLQLIDSGEDYELLNKSYVIFICLHDIFGKGRHQYTFKNSLYAGYQSCIRGRHNKNSSSMQMVQRMMLHQS